MHDAEQAPRSCNSHCSSAWLFCLWAPTGCATFTHSSWEHHTGNPSYIDVPSHRYLTHQGVTSNVQNHKAVRNQPLLEPSHKGWHALLSCICPCLVVQSILSHATMLTMNYYGQHLVIFPAWYGVSHNMVLWVADSADWDSTICACIWNYPQIHLELAGAVCVGSLRQMWKWHWCSIQSHIVWLCCCCEPNRLHGRWAEQRQRTRLRMRWWGRQRAKHRAKCKAKCRAGQRARQRDSNSE